MESPLVEKFRPYLTDREAQEMLLLSLGALDNNVNPQGVKRLEELIETAKHRARMLIV